MENERIEWGSGVKLIALAQDRGGQVMGCCCCCCKHGNNS